MSVNVELSLSIFTVIMMMMTKMNRQQSLSNISLSYWTNTSISLSLVCLRLPRIIHNRYYCLTVLLRAAVPAGLLQLCSAVHQRVRYTTVIRRWEKYPDISTTLRSTRTLPKLWLPASYNKHACKMLRYTGFFSQNLPDFWSSSWHFAESHLSFPIWWLHTDISYCLELLAS